MSTIIVLVNLFSYMNIDGKQIGSVHKNDCFAEEWMTENKP